MNHPLPTPAAVEDVDSIPTNANEFYACLTSRNTHFIDSKTQANIKKLKVLVAGCGAAGGACLEPLARVGVTQFRIADIGKYELSNLNRQHTFIDCLGMHKASFHELELKRINPHIDVIAYTQGIDGANTPGLVQWADIIFDCVDVTTTSAIQAKVNLHQVAHRERKPVFSMLDLGFCQWGIGYDYRKPKVQPLNGRISKVRSEKNPIRAFLKMFPLSVWPSHTLHLVEDILRDPTQPCSQLGIAADLLSAIAASAIVRFAKDKTLIKGWNLNLDQAALTKKERFTHFVNSPWTRLKILKSLRSPE